MKKKFKIYLIFLLVFFMFPTIINAEEKICRYDDTITSWRRIVFSLSENGKVIQKIYNLERSGFLGLGEPVASQVISETETNIINASDINSANCPKYAYMDIDSTNLDKIYLSNDLNSIWSTDVKFEITSTAVGDNSNLIEYTGDIGTLVFDSRTSFFANGNCNSDSGVFKLFKITYSLLKFASPITLVIFGMIDMVKAMTSSDESKMKKAQSAFVRRIIAAVIVFLSFVIVEFIVKMVDSGVLNCVSQLF